jgi:hypothetical protein
MISSRGRPVTSQTHLKSSTSPYFPSEKKSEEEVVVSKPIRIVSAVR